MLSLASQILDREFNILRKTFLLMDNTQECISGGLTPPPPNFHIFLKSEEKEVERGMGGGVNVNIFFGVEIFSGGGRVEIFRGVVGISSGGVEIFGMCLKIFGRG